MLVVLLHLQRLSRVFVVPLLLPPLLLLWWVPSLRLEQLRFPQLPPQRDAEPLNKERVHELLSEWFGPALLVAFLLPFVPRLPLHRGMHSGALRHNKILRLFYHIVRHTTNNTTSYCYNDPFLQRVVKEQQFYYKVRELKDYAKHRKRTLFLVQNEDTVVRPARLPEECQPLPIVEKDQNA